MHSVYKLGVTLVVALGLNSCASPYRLDCGRCEELVDTELQCLRSEMNLPDVLTLDEIIRIALDCNLELKARELGYQIQCEYANAERLGMLPNLMYNYHRNSADRHSGSSSVSLEAGRPPAPASVGREQHYDSWDFTLTWNLLDFGISYYRSMAQANRALALACDTEQVRHQLTEQIVDAYWQAVVARRGIEKAEHLIEQSLGFNARIQRLIDKQVIDSQDGLLMTEGLVSMRLALGGFQRDYAEAVNALRLHMGVSPTQQFTLAEPEWGYTPPSLAQLPDLERIAMSTRPELCSADHQEEAAMKDIRAEFLSLFPTPLPELAWNHDSNIYLIHHYWRTASLRVTHDLLSLPQRWKTYKTSQKQRDAVRSERLALGMAVISQVHLSFVMLQELANEYTLSLEFEVVKQELASNITKQLHVGVSHQLETLIRQAEAVEAEMRTLRVLRDVRVAEQRLKTAIGQPFYTWTGPEAEECICDQ